MYDVLLVNGISAGDPSERTIFTGLPKSSSLTNGWNTPLIKLGNTSSAFRVGIKQNSDSIGVWWQEFPTSDIYLNGQLIYISAS